MALDIRLLLRPEITRRMNDEVQTIETVDIAEILKALPHRYPFLMVDRIIELRSDESAIGIKNVTVNEPHFLATFPATRCFPPCFSSRAWYRPPVCSVSNRCAPLRNRSSIS